MIGLSILHDYTCVTGFVFYFNDNSSQLIGTNYDGIMTPILGLNAPNFNSLSVKSFADDVLYRIQICNTTESCVTAGDPSIDMNYNIDIYFLSITAFWASYGVSNGQYRCLRDFGIDYVDI